MKYTLKIRTKTTPHFVDIGNGNEIHMRMRLDMEILSSIFSLALD